MSILLSPTLSATHVAFVSEDDVWVAPREGGQALRLTFSSANAHSPHFSPDGRHIAYASSDDGRSDVFVVDVDGSLPRRLTWSGNGAVPMGWTPDGRVVVRKDGGLGLMRLGELWAIHPENLSSEQLAVGFAEDAAFGPQGEVVIQRKGRLEPALWKRYRGGLAGELWIDPSGTGEFHRILESLPGNVVRPRWVGDRVWFISDHEGFGNVYSCNSAGGDIRKHTHHTDYYARRLNAGHGLVAYQHGGRIRLLDPAGGESRVCPIQCPSTRAQLQEKFADPWDQLETALLHPKREEATVVTRGKLFHMGLWSGAVTQCGVRQGARYLEPAWLPSGEELVAASDEGGEWSLRLFGKDGAPSLISGSEAMGRPTRILAAPQGRRLAVANYRQELWMVSLDAPGETRLVAKGEYGLSGFAWSPDGRWLAFGKTLSPTRSAIFVCDSQDGAVHQVTDGFYVDFGPAWSPKGDHLYFISDRDLAPVYSSVYYDIGIPQAGLVFALSLRKEVRSPLHREPKPFEEPKEKTAEGNPKDASKEQPSAEGAKDEVKPVAIDFDGISTRYVAFQGIRDLICAIHPIEGKILFETRPAEGVSHLGTPTKGKMLKSFDLETEKIELLTSGIEWFQLSLDGKRGLLRSEKSLRLVKSGEKLDAVNDGEGPGRKSGLVDLARIRLNVDLRAEWKQMFREAWRLQREHFWVEDMSGIDWEEVYSRYLPLLDRCSARSEFADLVREIHGELGTSHAYEWGGDYRSGPSYPRGFLGADFELDDEGRWRIAHILRTDHWDPVAGSALAGPGVEAREGDLLLAIDGEPLDARMPPERALWNRALTEVELTLAPASDPTSLRKVTLKTRAGEGRLRYRSWVEANRAYVHEKSNGRLGYVHIPDMGPMGYTEFFRSYLPECERDGLVIDVRYNGGGNVSQHLIAILSKKVLGHCCARWSGNETYPGYAPRGPLVAIANSHSGSDGDIFPHAFKLAGLGKLVGTRTWGGVIGINPRHPLVDGTTTTQPEYSFWFDDVGWGVENYGTEPDVCVENTPQDEARGRDPQLDKAIELVLEEVQRHVYTKPDLASRPHLGFPARPR